MDLVDTKKQDSGTNDFEAGLISALKAGKPLLGSEGALTPLIKKALEAALEGEMESFLTTPDKGTKSTRRNGKTAKQVRSSLGSFELSTPRDRAGEFEPELVKKRQTILTDELDGKILGLFAQGISYSDIVGHLKDLYGIDVSTALISKVTDKLLPTIEEWQSQPLESVYPIVYLDAIHFKVREDGRVIVKALYTLLGIDQSGKKQILGLYISDAEGANFWCSVLADIKERGVDDILIACVDGLKGFPQAIASIFPNTEVQLCVVHQIRNSLRFVASKHQKEFMTDLKEVYRASSKEIAEKNLNKLDEKWGQKYPTTLKLWHNNWGELSTYFKYDVNVRKLVYTTNPVESVHRQIRKYTKFKGSFTSENALKKIVFCAYMKMTQKWTMPVQNWPLIVSQLDIHFPERLNLSLAA
jgi:putative transposase